MATFNKETYANNLITAGIPAVYRTVNTATARNPRQRWMLTYDNLLLNKITPVFVSTDYTPITAILFQKGQSTSIDSYFSGSREVYKSIIHNEKGSSFTVLTGDADPTPFNTRASILCSEYGAVCANIGDNITPITSNSDEYLTSSYVKRVEDLQTYVSINREGEKTPSIFSYVRVHLNSEQVPFLTFAVSEKAESIDQIYEKGATQSYQFMAAVLGYTGKDGILK